MGLYGLINTRTKKAVAQGELYYLDAIDSNSSSVDVAREGK